MSDKYTLYFSPKLPDQIAAIITRQIRDGLYRPGDTLPPEVQLRATFGVSRTVVREALSQLKYDGLLESRQGKGVVVLGPSGRRSFRMEGVERLTQEDLAQFYEMRAVIESETAALAASRRSARDLKRLKDCLERMARAVDSGADGTEPDLAFHRLIAEMSANAYLKDLMHYLNEKAAKVIRTARVHSSRDPGLPAVVQKEHEAIFGAVAAGDSEGARTTSLRHLKNAAGRLGLGGP